MGFVYDAIYTEFELGFGGKMIFLLLFFFTNIIIVGKKLLDEENWIKLRQSRAEQTTSITNQQKMVEVT